MIIRVFRAKVRPGTHQQYEALIHQRVVPLMLEAPGLLSLHVGLPLDDPPDEFLLMSVWQDLAAMRAFIGARWREPLAVPGEEHLVLHSVVDHYDGEELTGRARAAFDRLATAPADLLGMVPPSTERPFGEPAPA
jgi:heme-degrading monooxygenase HmoA